LACDFTKACNKTLREICAEERRKLWANDPHLVFTVGDKVYNK
jgi:hypothetical protein